MRILVAIVLLVLALGALASFHGSAASSSAAPATGPASIEVACSPRGGGIRAIRSAIALARARVAFLGPISGGDQVVDELRAAARRGVEVDLVVPPLADASSRALAKALIDSGGQLSEDDEHAGILGDTLVIDAETVVSAASIADAAEQDQVGVVLVVRDARTAASCADLWRVHAAHARPAGPPRAPHADAPTAAPTPPATTAPAPAAAPPSDGGSLSPFSTTHRQH